jgi:hypothetical protein
MKTLLKWEDGDIWSTAWGIGSVKLVVIPKDGGWFEWQVHGYDHKPGKDRSLEAAKFSAEQFYKMKLEEGLELFKSTI